MTVFKSDKQASETSSQIQCLLLSSTGEKFDMTYAHIQKKKLKVSNNTNENVNISDAQSYFLAICVGKLDN